MSSSSKIDEESPKSEMEREWMQLKIEQYKLKKDEETWHVQRRMMENLEKKLESQEAAFKEKYKKLEQELEELKSHNNATVKEYEENKIRLITEHFYHVQSLREEFEKELEEVRGNYHKREEEMQDEFDRRQQHSREKMYEQEDRAKNTLLRTQEHFDIIQRTHLTTVEKLVAKIDDLIIKNIELKPTGRNIEREDVRSDSKPNETSETRLDLQIISRYPDQKILISNYEYFFKKVIDWGRRLLNDKKRYEENHKFGYTLLNYMRTEENIKSTKIHLGNKLMGIEHEYPKKKLGLTSKMRKREPDAIQWHISNMQNNLNEVKSNIRRIESEFNEDETSDLLETTLIFLAYHVFLFQYSNQELALSGNSSYRLERDFPEVQNFDIIEWIFQFFAAIGEDDFSDRIDYYRSTSEEYLTKFERLELSDPLATN